MRHAEEERRRGLAGLRTNGDEEVAIAEWYVAGQECGFGPEDAEGQRVRLVVTGSPDEDALSSGSGCVAARP